MKSRVFVFHVRLGTTGDKTRENCHPFLWERWLFAHNGWVNREALLERLEPERRKALEGQTDSEVYFHWILQNIEEHGEVEGIKAAVKEVKGLGKHGGLNFILTNGSQLYAYRDAPYNLGYYSLVYLKRSPKPKDLLRFESRNPLRVQCPKVFPRGWSRCNSPPNKRPPWRNSSPPSPSKPRALV